MKRTNVRRLANPAIVHDARDPQFLQNLHNLGPVQMQTTRERTDKTTSMLDIMNARAHSEPEAAHDHVQGLSASELVRLLEEYQTSPTPAQLDKLAVAYDVPRDRLTSLVAYVQAPAGQPLREVPP